MIEHTQYPSAIRHDASTHSGVSWAAIFAGATAAAALSQLLLMLGAGLGFSTMSPWAGEGLGAKGLGVSAIIWLAVTQILASGMGGYVSAGHLISPNSGATAIIIPPNVPDGAAVAYR